MNEELKIISEIPERGSSTIKNQQSIISSPDGDFGTCDLSFQKIENDYDKELASRKSHSTNKEKK